MIKNLLFVVLTLARYLPACGQSDTVFVNEINDQISLNPYFKYFSSDSDMPVKSAWLRLKTKTNTQQAPPINMGVVNGFFWFSLSVRNTTQKDQSLILRLDQPHIYRVNFYSVKNDTPVFKYQAGLDYPFHDRPIPVRYMAFPIDIPALESSTTIVKIHHINSLSFPAYLVTPAKLMNSNYKQNLGWGLWVGFILFCALLAFIGGMILRRSVFVWYSLYMLGAAFYGIVELGYGFQFLYPTYPKYSATIIVDAGLLTFILFIKFTQALLETRKNFPFANRVLSIIAIVFTSLVVLGFLILDVMLKITPILLPIVNCSILVTLAILTYVGVKSLAYNKIVAIFYLISYGILIGCSTILVLNVAFGIFNYFGTNPILFGYLSEAILLSVAIAFFFDRINSERLRLAIAVTTQQKEMYQQYLLGIDKERSRIAGELHDDIGSRLSYLKRLLDTSREDSTKASNEVEFLIEDVRNLSHELAPPMANNSELLPLLEKLITDNRRSAGIDIKLQVHQFKEVLNQVQILQSYRIVQEAINNALKHSRPDRIDVQLFGRPDEFSITVEDNGSGFDSSTSTNGIGISQMKIRAESINGKLDINSMPGKGCQVTLAVPIVQALAQDLGI